MSQPFLYFLLGFLTAFFVVTVAAVLATLAHGRRKRRVAEQAMTTIEEMVTAAGKLAGQPHPQKTDVHTPSEN